MSSPITTLREKVHQHFEAQETGHGRPHVERVVSTALYIVKKEFPSINPVLVEAIALTHDIGDWKFSTSGLSQKEEILQFIDPVGFTQEKKEHIATVAANISFSKTATKDPYNFICQKN